MVLLPQTWSLKTQNDHQGALGDVSITKRGRRSISVTLCENFTLIGAMVTLQLRRQKTGKKNWGHERKQYVLSRVNSWATSNEVHTL